MLRSPAILALVLGASIILVLGQVRRGDPLPRGVSEIERDVTIDRSKTGAVELTQLPAWAEQGRFTFMRMDGGIMEREKAKRSTYGRSFTPEESEILGDLYTTHAERAVALMKEAGVSWVWITWSNGWSREYESGQWDVLRALIKRLHEAGLKVTAYLCATSLFWQNMFMDEPRSVAWLAYLPSNLRIPYGNTLDRPPYPYTPDWTPVTYGQRSGYRFIADVANPEWREYVKVRLGAALDAGVDGVFFDNPLVGRPRLDEAIGFFTDMQAFIKQVKKSAALLSTHIGAWLPNTVPLEELCEVVYSGGVEPGIIDGRWRTNIAEWRYKRALVGDKPMYGEIIGNFPPSGTTGIMSPKAEKIALAEGAAAQHNVANRVFGPFLKGIVRNEPGAMSTWAAIGTYNRFILSHPELFAGARIVPDVLVLIPDEWPFGDEGQAGALLEYLVQRSIQFDSCGLGRLNESILKQYSTLLAGGIDRVTAGRLRALGSFQRAGGKIYALGSPGIDKADVRSAAVTLASANESREVGTEIEAKLAALLRSRKVQFENPGHVLATLARVGGHRVVAHFINYDTTAHADVKAVLDLGSLAETLDPGSVRAYSPDSGGDRVSNVGVNGHTVSFTIPKLDTYCVVSVDARVGK